METSWGLLGAQWGSVGLNEAQCGSLGFSECRSLGCRSLGLSGALGGGHRRCLCNCKSNWGPLGLWGAPMG